MMCPNKNHPDWKEMVEKYGKIEAFRHWLKGNYSVSEAKKSDQSKVAETPIKEGVAELFESNPELANAVYESLGFTGNISLESNLKNTGKTEEELIKYLKEKYPEIKLNITNNPAWEQGDNVFNQKEYNNQVQYRLKAVNTLVSDKAKQIFEKGKNNNWGLNKILTELQIPKEQKQIILDKDITDREEIIASLLADNSFAIEINTAKDTTKGVSDSNRFRKDGVLYESWNNEYTKYTQDGKVITISKDEYDKALNSSQPNTQYYSYLTVPGGANYTENEIATPAIKPAIKGHAQFATDNGIGWFRSDEQRVGGKTATEMGADDFIENPNGQKINPDNVTIGGKDTKTRRILELQSDLFQKGRNRKDLITNPEVNASNTPGMRGVTNMEEMLSAYEYSLIEYENKTKEEADELVSKERKRLLGLSSSKEGFNENKFLQLLNKKGNWVNFFVQSIIQDSAKKGYEKVLFPKGDTISKIEGHTTLEEFKKQKEDRIKEIEKQLEKPKYVVDWLDTSGYGDENIIFETEQEAKDYVKIENAKLPEDVEGGYILLFNRERLNNEINQLKQEIKRVEEEGFGALRPIYDFYENRVTNTLNKLYDVKEITDEYGNKWNEITITPEVLSEIMLQRNEANQIIGQANIKAMTVLVDAVNKKADTIPHEYAHHYIAWFRNTPIVQEGIKRFGSEEALVQAIGEQVVKQKGEAYNWWKKFTNFILRLLSDKQLLQVLTDSFLNRTDLNDFTYSEVTPQQKEQAQQQYSQYLNTIFPDSKVKDIVYHDTSHNKAIKNYKEYLQSKYDKKIDYINKEIFGDPNYIEVFFKDGTSEILNEEESLKFVPFETFDKNLIGSIDGSVSGKGFYFYTNPEERYNRSRFFTLNALINVKNTADKSDSNLKDLFEEPSKSTDLLKKQGYDSVVGKLSTIGTEYVVFEPEQIHILGSKQDIKGFKEFVGEPKTEKKVDNTIFKPTPVEVQKQRPSTENVMREFTGRSIDEIFEQHKEALEQAGITLDQLKHSAAKNNLSNEEIEQWLQTCLGSSKKGSSNIRPPMAKQGMKSSKFTKGGKWRLIKDLKGYPTHEKGGVDLMIGKDGVSITSGQSNFKAEYGLILPYNVKDYV